MTPESKIIRLAELRETLARFPAAAAPPERVWESGWAALDERGPLRRAEVAELCAAPALGALFLHQILGALRRRREFAALIDCGRTFDPDSYRGMALERLLCIASDTAEQGVKAADLLLRDGNLPVVLLDLQALPLRSLGRIPANTWHRFHRLVEKSGTLLVVMTPQPVVEAARIRITLRGRWELSALSRRRAELIAALDVQVFHRGRAASRASEPLVQTA
jgi:hypothetical protein